MRHPFGCRRTAIVLAVSALMALAACSEQPQTPTRVTTGERGAGGDLRIISWKAPTTLNPHQASDPSDNDASRLILQPLASWDKDGKPVANAMAVEIPTVQNGGVAKDFTSVTWKLRRNAKWSDGTQFTAEDVTFTYRYMCDESANASTVDVCEGVRSVNATDPYTAVVTYNEARPYYFQWGVGRSSQILQKAQYSACLGEKARSCSADTKPIGTGPYKVREFRPGDLVTYEINESYWDPSKPFFKTVTLKGGADPVAAARAVFVSGDVDYAWQLQIEPRILRPMVQNSTAANLVTAYSSGVERIILNRANPDPALGPNRSEPDTKHPFLSDIAVRRALAMATDRASIGRQLYGTGEPGESGRPTCNLLTGPAAVVSKNTDGMDICKFDLNAANAELDNAGWARGADGVRSKDGVRLKILFLTTANTLRQKEQEIVKDGWERSGFEVVLRSEPTSTFFSWTAPGGAAHFFADVEMFADSGDPDPTSYLSRWTCREAAGASNSWRSPGYERFCSPEYDRIVAQLRVETSEGKRNQLAIQANDLLVRDVVVIPLVERPTVSSGVSKLLKGASLSGWDSEMYNVAEWFK